MVTKEADVLVAAAELRKYKSSCTLVSNTNYNYTGYQDVSVENIL